MFRRRKNPTPGFRIPVPYNPLTGEHASFIPQYKLFCDFILTEELTTSDQSAAAEIDSQWGPGQPHAVLEITVFNMPASVDYTFEGEVGAMGVAAWDQGTNWCILNMECPAP